MTLLTENEAREQTCPLIRFCVNEEDVLQRAAMPLYVHQNCQASDCKIGWRWERGKYAVTKPQPDDKGYCGAFGRPE